MQFPRAWSENTTFSCPELVLYVVFTCDAPRTKTPRTPLISPSTSRSNPAAQRVGRSFFAPRSSAGLRPTDPIGWPVGRFVRRRLSVQEASSFVGARSPEVKSTPELSRSGVPKGEALKTAVKGLGWFGDGLVGTSSWCGEESR